jgi:arabinose-5-phosphate isomerase
MPIGLKRDRLLRDDRGEAIASATRTLQLEAEGLSALMAALAGDLVEGFAEALERIRACRGRVIVTGMGKSGHVGL